MIRVKIENSILRGVAGFGVIAFCLAFFLSVLYFFGAFVGPLFSFFPLGNYSNPGFLTIILWGFILLLLIGALLFVIYGVIIISKDLGDDIFGSSGYYKKSKQSYFSRKEKKLGKVYGKK